MLAKSITAILASTVVLVGCTSTIHRTVDIDNGKGLSLDAKQRLLLVTNRGGIGEDRRIVCAEPSPDAITSLAAAASASGGTFNAGGSLAFGSNEAAASIGLRTQTTQLLRDGYYRLCEAYMNGALSREQYNFALVNIDHVMIPIMAIDAIAGAPRPPAVALAPGNPGSNSSTTATDSESSNSGDEASTQSASFTGESSVGSSATMLNIEAVTQSRVGLSKDETAVLKQALELVDASSIPVLCASYLADPNFTAANGSIYSASSTTGNGYQLRFAEACSVFLERKLAPNQTQLAFTKLLNDLQEATTKIEKKEEQLKELKSKLNAAQKQNMDLVSKAKAEQTELAKDFAGKALNGRNIVIK